MWLRWLLVILCTFQDDCEYRAAFIEELKAKFPNSQSQQEKVQILTVLGPNGPLVKQREW